MNTRHCATRGATAAVVAFAGLVIPGLSDPAGAAERLPVSGLGSGTFETCVTCQPGEFAVRGTYASVGQLGSGTYSFEVTDDGPCDIEPASFLKGHVELIRSDGARLGGDFSQCAPHSGALDFSLGQFTLTGGTRDLVSARLSFSVKALDAFVTPSGTHGRASLGFTGSVNVSEPVGYWMVDESGVVSAFGGAQWQGNAPTPTAARAVAPTSTGDGYWVVNISGQVYAFGHAHWYGNADTAAFAAGEVV